MEDRSFLFQERLDHYGSRSKLRGLDCQHSIRQPDIWPMQIAYPQTGQGWAFNAALMRLLYGYGVWGKLKGVMDILTCMVIKPTGAFPLSETTTCSCPSYPPLISGAKCPTHCEDQQAHNN